MKCISKIVVMLGIGFVAISDAQAREFADIYTECGLGAIIAPRTPAVAAITNVTWDSGTTAISSNVSSPDTCSGGKAKTAAFINKTYEALEMDLARGTGKYLDALAELVVIKEDYSQNFKEVLRKDFLKITQKPEFIQKTRFEKVQALYNLIYKTV